ncbi:heavy-metal-associated domain-containing protein [Flavobacterium jejuense]|uniref:Heavy-metal-associated domain-containing protein n=1 Tax=Flavobacterium jejuense TaxID=1544455 RepID=A0ABX0IS05_9FLAO|nr:heavy metal-associated domain-containing protein [Flavobacterium jejuense]NHN26662.1 heavy-metal-associated domain-containing protein [Flavobacterium jejuense]
MKEFKLIALSAFTAILFVSCKNENANTVENNTTTVAPENLATASFTIDGMTCPEGCAKLIENKLASLNGVSEAKVDFENKKATVTFDNEKQTPETLAETVEKVGGGELYKVSDVKSSTDKAYYNGKDKKKKKKSKGKEKVSSKENVEKKSCCAGKSSCGEKKESGTL